MGARRPPASQAGFSLIETIIAAAILAIVAGGAIAAFAGVARVSAPDPARTAAEQAMRRIVTLLQTASKYADPQTVGVNPAPWNTTLPNPSGTAYPVTISAAKTSAPGGGFALTVTIVYPRGAGTATLSTVVPLVQKAPAPNAQIAAPGSYADPSATATP